MGVSMRVRNYRYTEWVGYDYEAGAPIWSDLRGAELYDHTLDDAAGADGDSDNNFDSLAETLNLADDPAHASLRAQLSSRLRASWSA